MSILDYLKVLLEIYLKKSRDISLVQEVQKDDYAKQIDLGVGLVWISVMAIFTDLFNIFCSFWLYEMFSTRCFQHFIKESWLSRQVEFCIWNSLFSVLHTFHTPKHKVINKHGWLTWEVDLISEFTTHIIKKRTPICSLKQPVLLQGQPTLCNQPLNML